MNTRSNTKASFCCTNIYSCDNGHGLGKQQLGSVPSRWHIFCVGDLLRWASQSILKYFFKRAPLPAVAHVPIETINNVVCKLIEALCKKKQRICSVKTMLRTFTHEWYLLHQSAERAILKMHRHTSCFAKIVAKRRIHPQKYNCARPHSPACTVHGLPRQLVCS